MVFKLNVPYVKDAEEHGHLNFTRVDLLCGFPWKPPIFPCKVCGSETCEGKEGSCKNEGAYSLGISYKG